MIVTKFGIMHSGPNNEIHGQKYWNFDWHKSGI